MGCACCSDGSNELAGNLGKPVSSNFKSIRQIEDISSLYQKQKEMDKDKRVYEVKDLKDGGIYAMKVVDLKQIEDSTKDCLQLL